MMAVLVTLAAAQAADLDAALSDAGWAHADDVTTAEIGTVVLETRTLDGERCLRGRVTVDVPPDPLVATVSDIPAAPRFSRETLLASRTLGHDGGAVHYYQHLDIPGWTLVADRYWVVSGWRRDVGATRVFAWDRFDWRARYPELAAELARDHPAAVEPDPNYGAWSFAPAGAGSVVTYTLCNNAAGSLPEWVVRAAATRTFPNTIVDIVLEGRRRAKTGPASSSDG